MENVFPYVGGLRRGKAIPDIDFEVDGVKLVELWIDGFEETEQEINRLIPETN